jgi:hypothetical protein
MISVAQFRAFALALPGAEEHAHMGHPDFRVRNKIFATLWPDENRAVIIKVALADQAALVQMHPQAFSLNAWSHRGALNVHLEHADAAQVQVLLTHSWREIAPRKQVALFDAKD